MKKYFPALILVAASAAGADDPLAALRACTAQTDDDGRLACFDAAMKALAAPEAVKAEESFGYRGDVAREALDRKQEAAPPQLEQLDASITAVELQPRGEFVVTLDNGQVWAQKRPETKVRPAVGDRVSIKPASLGSFLLVTSSGRSTRVSRVR